MSAAATKVPAGGLPAIECFGCRESVCLEEGEQHDGATIYKSELCPNCGSVTLVGRAHEQTFRGIQTGGLRSLDPKCPHCAEALIQPTSKERVYCPRCDVTFRLEAA